MVSKADEMANTTMMVDDYDSIFSYTSLYSFRSAVPVE